MIGTMNKYSQTKNSFVMPFEGDLHDGTIMMLPYRDDTWRNNGEIASKSFFEIINTIALYEKVYVLVDEKVKYDISPIMNNKNIILLNINYDDCWARDTSPIFIRNGKKLGGIDFRFNAWGGLVDGLYADFRNDDEVASKICKELKFDHYYVKDFILEGGSIHTDGKGLFITTEACLLSSGRNPHLTKEQIEDNLKKYLGAKKIIWLPRGIYNDETNEHVDNIACFVRPGVVAIAFPLDENDVQYELSKASYDVLLNSTDIDGNKLEVVKIVMPTPMYLTNTEASGITKNETSKPRLESDRLAGSYINYYQGKDYIILPKFNVEEDKIALKQFQGLYKDKKIHQIDSKEILLGGGNIHCITMQIPKGENNNER